MRNQRGFSLVELLIVVAILGIIVAIALPYLFNARRTSNESAAIGSLRSLGSAETTYFARTGFAGSFADLVTAQMVDANWSNNVTRSNYVYTEAGIAPSLGLFCFQATPTGQVHGTKSFNILEDMVIRFQSGQTPLPRGSGTAIGVE